MELTSILAHLCNFSDGYVLSPCNRYMNILWDCTVATDMFKVNPRALCMIIVSPFLSLAALVG